MTSTPTFGMRPIRVLLVEDHDFTRLTLAAALREGNCTVVSSVPSAGDAITAIHEHEVDCAVIDLNLGRGPSGIDVSYGLREHDPHIGIVLLTAFGDRRLHSSDSRPLPKGAQYVVKDDVRSSADLRAAIESSLDEGVQQIPHSMPRLPLTDLQAEIVRMVYEGLTNAEISRIRGVSERSVQTAIGRIVVALGLEVRPGQSPRALIQRTCRASAGTPNRG